MDVRVLVGQNVRRLRLAAELSQEAVAERMGVDRAYVSALELGKRNPTIITLWQIAEALKVELVDLVSNHTVRASDVPSTRVRRKRE